MERHAAVIITRGKAFFPTTAVTEAGFLQYVEPVHVVDPEADKMLETLRLVLEVGNPRIPTPPVHELDHRSRRNDPVLRATDAGSWKELGARSAAYAVTSLGDRTILYVFKLDKKGRFVTDATKTTHFPPDVDLEALVTTILEDASHQAVLRKDDTEKK